MRAGIGWVVISALLLTLVGCGGVATDTFKGARGSVSGKVTFKGAPVPAGSVIAFLSKEGGYSAGGKINDKGEYTLSYEGNSSLPAVVYAVQVSPPPVAGSNTAPDPSKTVDAKPAAAAAAPFPTKYGAIATSGLEYTVKAGANKADFDLKEE